VSDSVAFDRAAAYYDQTRGLSAEGVAKTTRTLTEAFGGARPVLEIGVGTGQVALPLHGAGVPVVGMDLSRPMLDRLIAKAGAGSAPPLVLGDATAMPFGDGAFGAAYLRWVLHLIPDWRSALAEIARVVAPGGVFVAVLGSYGGKRNEIQARFAEITGISTQPAGLTWDGWGELDAAVASLGGRKLPDLSFEDEDRDDLETFVRGVEQNMFSWTWAVPDDELRREAAAEARRWAEERWGPLDAVPRSTFRWRFARYRMA
jgi:SAM-dependent methyltransferase